MSRTSQAPWIDAAAAILSGSALGQRDRQSATHAEPDHPDVARPGRAVGGRVVEQGLRVADDVARRHRRHQFAAGVHVLVGLPELAERPSSVEQVRQHDVVAGRRQS